MAAPDHKIRQCIQRSALFPGRANRCPITPISVPSHPKKIKIGKNILRAIITQNSGIFRAKIMWNSKIWLTFWANIIKIRVFCNFSDKNNVKFGHFVNFFINKSTTTHAEGLLTDPRTPGVWSLTPWVRIRGWMYGNPGPRGSGPRGWLPYTVYMIPNAT